MKSFLSVAAIALLAGSAAGAQTTRSFPVSGFDRVSLRGPDAVSVRVGPAESVSVSGPAELLDALEVEVRDGELRLGRKRGSGSWTGGRGGAAVFTVTLPRLTAASVAGSGDMTVDRAEAKRFAASVAGSGNLGIGQLRADDVVVSIAGSGDARIAGQARSLTASVAGSGDIDATGLRTETARVSIAGSGDVRADVSREADLSVMGSGDVDIAGGASCRVSKMGSGSVRCAGALASR